MNIVAGKHTILKRRRMQTRPLQQETSNFDADVVHAFRTGWKYCRYQVTDGPALVVHPREHGQQRLDSAFERWDSDAMYDRALAPRERETQTERFMRLTGFMPFHSWSGCTSPTGCTGMRIIGPPIPRHRYLLVTRRDWAGFLLGLAKGSAITWGRWMGGPC